VSIRVVTFVTFLTPLPESQQALGFCAHHGLFADFKPAIRRYAPALCRLRPRSSSHQQSPYKIAGRENASPTMPNQIAASASRGSRRLMRLRSGAYFAAP
jgi:hypothetical protein